VRADGGSRYDGTISVYAVIEVAKTLPQSGDKCPTRIWWLLPTISGMFSININKGRSGLKFTRGTRI